MKVILALTILVAAVASEGLIPVDNAVSGQPQQPDCMVLSRTSKNGYLATAQPLADADSDGPKPRSVSCSSAENSACYSQCRSYGYNGGACCCSCGSVRLCQCY